MTEPHRRSVPGHGSGRIVLYVYYCGCAALMPEWRRDRVEVMAGPYLCDRCRSHQVRVSDLRRGITARLGGVTRREDGKIHVWNLQPPRRRSEDSLRACDPDTEVYHLEIIVGESIRLYGVRSTSVRSVLMRTVDGVDGLDLTSFDRTFRIGDPVAYGDRYRGGGTATASIIAITAKTIRAEVQGSLRVRLDHLGFARRNWDFGENEAAG